MLAFFQTPYIEKFVSVISQRRALSTSPFYKNILKLQVNFVFCRSLLEKDYQLNVFLKYICIDFSMTCSSHFTDEEITLNYTDTDSLLLSIVTECDVFEVLRQPSIAHYLDQSVYAEGASLKG